MTDRRFLTAVFMITLGVLSTITVLPIRGLSVVPSFTSGNSSALLGIFSEAKSSNVVFDTGIGNGGTVVMDVNLTNAGPIRGIQVGVNFTASALTAASVAFCSTASCGPTIKNDAKIRYVNTTVTQAAWTPSNAVIYDNDLSGTFTAGDTVIFGTTPSTGTKLKTDTHIKYVDANSGGTWNTPESVFYDADASNTYTIGDTSIANAVPTAFEGISILNTQSQIDNTKGFINYAIADSDNNHPTASGTGVLLRITFTTKANTVAALVHINTGSAITNPNSVPYQTIDGYINTATATPSFAISNNQAAVNVIRPVLGTATNSTLPIATISVTGTGPVSLKVLGLPRNTVAVLSASSCPTPPCNPTLQIQVNGGSAGGANTAPSGTYPLSIVGNATATPGFLIRLAWMKLTILPPHPPTFTVTSTKTSFTQEAGNYTLSTVTVSLTCSAPTNCANDTVGLSSNVNLRAGGSQGTFNPESGSFTLTSAMNVSTPTGVTLGTYTFNITATTTGTYSEVSKTNFVTITMNIVRTHDLQVNSELDTRSFAYSGISLAAHPIVVTATIKNGGTVSETFNANATAKVKLSNDNLITFVDLHGTTGAFKTGDPVVYDTDSSGSSNAGDVLMAQGQTYSSDTHIKYVNTTTAQTTWAPTNTVIYDANNDNKYNSGDSVISGAAPALNAALKSDPLIKYADFNGNTVWNTGEGVAYDANNNNHYDIGERSISPNNGLFLQSDFNNNLKFVDSNLNNVWNSGESVAYDNNGNGVYDSGADSQIVTVVASPVISGGYLAGTQNGIVLAAGASAPVTFNWDPGALPIGNYQLVVWAVPVTNEFRIDNNFLGILPFTMRLKGDTFTDCIVDISDLSKVGAHMGSFGGFVADDDLNNDGTIDILDLVFVSSNMGHTC